MHPTRRIHIYPLDAKRAEVIILGDPIEIAPLFASMIHQAHDWRGFVLSQPMIGVAGIVVTLGDAAVSSDPVGEVLECFRREMVGVRWAASNDAPRLGVIGTW